MAGDSTLCGVHNTSSFPASISIPVTSPSHSWLPLPAARPSVVNDTSNFWPNAYSRFVRNFTFPGDTSVVIVSSGHGMYSGRTRIGNATFLPEPFFSRAPLLPLPERAACTARWYCRATFHPRSLFALRITRARVSGCIADASESNGNVTHNGCPGACACAQLNSSPPREALTVSHCSVRWPRGADHLSLAG